MLLPSAVLAGALGVGGSVLIRGVVQRMHDRALDASVLAIAERLGTDERNSVTVDLPRVALGILGTRAQDSVFYSVSYGGALVTGYADLPRADIGRLSPGTPWHFNTAYRDTPIRVAAQAEHIYGKPQPVLIEVAETLNARRSLEYEMFAALVVLEAGLLGLVGFLTLRGIDRGLEPLSELSREIEKRATPDGTSLKPLDVRGVPEETLAPVVAFNALMERLGQSTEALRLFTADASHQMRTPLAVLRMYLELARRHGPATPEGQTALSEVDSAARRLERLIEQLLALARADDRTGPDNLPDKQVDLAALAADIVTERVPQAIGSGMDVQFERPDAPVPVWGNEMPINELIANLLDNAIRYNRAGGTVIVRVNADAVGARLEIQDQGPGIPPAERAQVFERFYRVPRKEGPEGTGLGLAIVRALADRLGASVRLKDPSAGQGLLAVVQFRRPLKKSART